MSMEVEVEACEKRRCGVEVERRMGIGARACASPSSCYSRPRTPSLPPSPAYDNADTAPFPSHQPRLPFLAITLDEAYPAAFAS
jgi:hypothetical protein